jgi:formylglycine-generating enzyme required for sulfatase activity
MKEVAMRAFIQHPFSLACFVVVAAVWPADGQPKTFTNDIGMEFVLVPAGDFEMGPLRVRISKPFFLGKYEVTQDQWVRVMHLNPSYFNETRHPDDWRKYPVEQVSWADARKFVERLSARDKSYCYRLPTEAEWEYAARAGGPALKATGWYLSNSGDATHPVGQQPPNAWGFHDMVGNVWEWCQDWFHPSLPSKGLVVDPAGPAKGKHRVVRGGAWCFGPECLRLSYRYYYEPDHRDSCGGLRLVAEPVNRERTNP